MRKNPKLFFDLRHGTPSALDRKRQRGVALLMVLWVLVLLTVMAGGVIRLVKGDLEIVRNGLDRAEGLAIAEGAVYRAIAGLRNSTDNGGWEVAGAVYGWREGEAEIRITVEDEGGKVDLNGADLGLLGSLMRAAGLESGAADALADAVGDFRDEDKLQLLNGAEDRDYEDAGLGYGAKDQAFTAVEEFRQVFGVTPELYAKLAESLTVYTGQSAPFKPTAPPLVQAAMSAFASEQGALLEEELADGFGDLAEEDGFNALDGAGSQGFSSTTAPDGPGFIEIVKLVEGETDQRSQVPIYLIHVEVQLPGGALVVQDVIARVLRSRSQPYTIFRWQQGRPRLFNDPSKATEEDDDGNLFGTGVS
ncbi:MAG: hypothetical protein AAF530_13700 [Pseudomonadota bacterium]